MIELSSFFSFIFLSALAFGAIFYMLGFAASRFAKRKQALWLNEALRDQANERMATKEELTAVKLQEMQ